MAQKLTPCLWMQDIEGAAKYYSEVFKSDGKVAARYPDGRPLTAHVDILGTTFMLLGDQTEFKPNESVSFTIDCKDQAEVDYYWNHFVGDGGAFGAGRARLPQFLDFFLKVLPHRTLLARDQGRLIANIEQLRDLLKFNQHFLAFGL